MTTLQHLAPNQTVLALDNGTEILFSYSTPVAAFVPGRGYVKTDRRYSVTTSKHINGWAGKTAATVPQNELNALVP